MSDFPDKELGKVAPYGVYDLTANAGWVNVGTSADTAQFAVESIRRWWNLIGRPGYPAATRLLITADAGGSNGARLRLWKTELAAFAAESGLEITVVHFPPGTSKWNRVEHRLFSYITMNWRARPLESHEVVIQTIAATTTRTGLAVRAMLDISVYQTGIRISDKDMKAFEARHLHRHQFHGNWNYTVNAGAEQNATRPESPTKFCATLTEDRDFISALYGTPTVRYYQNAGPGTPPPASVRQFDGLWARRHGWHHTQVSAVLASTRIMPWTVGSAVPTLWHHPGAGLPVNEICPLLRQARLDLTRGQIQYDAPEITPHEFFELPEGWPEQER